MEGRVKTVCDFLTQLLMGEDGLINEGHIVAVLVVVVEGESMGECE